MDGSDLQSCAEALKGASETLLIPLACRARGSRERVLKRFSDPAAEQLVKALGVDLERYAVSREMLLGVIHRGDFFDRRCLDFLSRCPSGTVLNLGAGLNTSYERIRQAFPDGDWRWIDTDLAPSSSCAKACSRMMSAGQQPCWTPPALKLSPIG